MSVHAAMMHMWSYSAPGTAELRRSQRPGVTVTGDSTVTVAVALADTSDSAGPGLVTPGASLPELFMIVR